MFDLYSREHIGPKADIWVRAWLSIYVRHVMQDFVNYPCLLLQAELLILISAALYFRLCVAQSLGVLFFYMCYQRLPFEGECKLQVPYLLLPCTLKSKIFLSVTRISLIADEQVP